MLAANQVNVTVTINAERPTIDLGILGIEDETIPFQRVFTYLETGRNLYQF